MNLLKHAKDKYSASGNDGIIEEIFKRLSIKNGFFVEFGAWDGVLLSNCRKLFEEGWSGIFIEANESKYADLAKEYQWFSRIKCINSFVDAKDNTLDNVTDGLVPKSGIDFCSIDIDGLDLDVFESIKKNLPKVVCIEGGQMLDPMANRVSEEKASQNIQQSLSVLYDSFSERGYEIVCSHQDSFFIKKDLLAGCNFFNSDSPPKDLEKKLKYHFFQGIYHIPRRLPYIKKMASQVGLENKTVDSILKGAGVREVASGKQWSLEEVEKVKTEISRYL